MTNYDQFWVQVFITTTTYGVTMVVQYKEHIPYKQCTSGSYGTKGRAQTLKNLRNSHTMTIPNQFLPYLTCSKEDGFKVIIR